ncbi:MAG: hypothetical protein WCH65_01780 [bacterium]
MMIILGLAIVGSVAFGFTYLCMLFGLDKKEYATIKTILFLVEAMIVIVAFVGIFLPLEPIHQDIGIAILFGVLMDIIIFPPNGIRKLIHYVRNGFAIVLVWMGMMTAIHTITHMPNKSIIREYRQSYDVPISDDEIINMVVKDYPKLETRKESLLFGFIALGSMVIGISILVIGNKKKESKE